MDVRRADHQARLREDAGGVPHVSRPQQRDRVGLVTFDDDIVDFVPRSAKHLDVVLHTLDRAKAVRPGRLGAPLKKLAEHFGRRGIVVLISDLYEEPEDVMDALSLIRFRGNDVIIFHVLDPAEIEFDFHGSVERSRTSRPAIRSRSCRVRSAEQYRALVREHIAALTARAAEHRVDYTMLNTSTPLDYALFSYLVDARSTDEKSLMSFLAPLFFAGLSALAIPVLIHLIQRERKNVVVVPVADVPEARAVRVRAPPTDSQLVRCWRCGSRAGLHRRRVRPAVSARVELAASTDGSRDVVILLDRSYSMGHGDQWQRRSGPRPTSSTSS